jgi:magnesium chelatase family protein
MASDMLARVYASAINGIDATLVRVEVDVLSRGLPGWNMVGLLETAVKEARDRVGSAIRNAGYNLPNRRTIVNLAPADVRKSGAHYDLAIAIGLLCATRSCRPHSSARFLIAGELSLKGEVLPIDGAFLMAQAGTAHGLEGIILPAENAAEAQLADAGTIVPVKSLVEAVEFLNSGRMPAQPTERWQRGSIAKDMDLGDVRGQPFAKRGLEIAAAGGHHAVLKGPPGTGKTMLAERLPTILPPLTHQEALEVLKIKSWHGLLKGGCWLPTERPFRAPHHSASYAGLIGGGQGGLPRLGEISLAHNGVLFLDEMGEFRKDVLEVLRQPMESGWVRIVRAGVSIRYPARFMLVAAFNPCRCGYLGHPTRPCICTIQQIRSYRTKMSGPLMDRIDLHIEVAPPPHEALLEPQQKDASDRIRDRVMEARTRQEARLGGPGKCNACISSRNIGRYCRLGHEEKLLLRKASSELSLSARSVHRVIKVARTIADLEDHGDITSCHIAEALQFRPKLDDII